MTPDLKPEQRGVLRPPDQLAEGARVLIHDAAGIVAIGRVIDLDGILRCQGATAGALHRLGVRDQYVRLLRPPNDVRIPDGTPVWLRMFVPEWATVELEGTIKAAIKAGGVMRYNVAYLASDDKRAVAFGVHPDDIELRPADEDEPDDVNQHLVDEQSTALRDIGWFVADHGAHPAKTVYDQVVQVVTRFDEEAKAAARLLVGNGARPDSTLTQMVREAVASTRAQARANATAHAEQAAAAKIRQLEQRIRELENGAGEEQSKELFRLLSYERPVPHGAGLTERLNEVLKVLHEQIRALEADKSTLLAQVGEAVAAPDVIREQSLEAMSLLASHIPGVQGFTLPQKLREVLADKSNQIAALEMAVAARKPSTVIVGADRVRAVISRALSDRLGWAVENLNRMLNEDHDAVGGWFLRTLANANLAVIVHNWDGLDPVAEPVEPTAEPVAPDKPATPTLDDVKAAFSTMFEEIGKVPEAIRQALADADRARKGDRP